MIDHDPGAIALHLTNPATAALDGTRSPVDVVWYTPPCTHYAGSLVTLPPALVPPNRRRGVSTVAHESLTRAVLLELEVGGALPRSIVLEISRHRWAFAKIPGCL